MRRRKYGIISLDIAAALTGWSYCVKDKLKNYGTIKTSPKITTAQRLAIFRVEIIKVFKKYNPSNVVIENGYFGGNVLTLKILSKFGAIAEECAVSFLGVEPYIMNNRTVKKHFNVKTKEQLYTFMVDVYMLKFFKFKTHNDVVDAYAQSICFYERELNNIFMRKRKKV